MQNIKTRFLSNIIFFFLIYALMFYVVLRAINLVITHDEAYSFYNVKHFWYVETLCTGNTHWFNFLALKASLLLGLEKASQLRWFSVFSAGIFLICAYFWIKSLKDWSTKAFAFSFTLLNPYLIDYLGLARGYATGLMFESLAMLCIIVSFKNDKKNTALLSLFFAGMAAIANFNFFYFFAAFALLYFYKNYFSKGIGFLKQKLFYAELFYTLVITCLVLRALKFIVLCSNDIGDYGGNDLITSVFAGYIDTWLYGKYQISISTLNVGAYVLFFVVVALALYGIITFKKHKNFGYKFASSILLIMLLFMLFNKWFLNVLYPTYRTTLMFYPLIALVMIGFINSMITKAKTKMALLYCSSIIFFIHFVTTINIRKTFDYYYQEDSKTGFTYLESIGAKKVGIDPFLYGVFRNYYQQTEHLKFSFNGQCLNTFAISRASYGNHKLQDFDYLALYPPYNMRFYKNSKVKLEVVKFYKNSGTLLLKVYERKSFH